MWTFVRIFKNEVRFLRNAIFEKHKFENILNITKLVTVHYFEYDKDFVFEGESHDFWEMVYVDNGEVIITADKEEFTLKEGELYFHRPSEFHKVRANGKTSANAFVATFVCSSAVMKLFIKRKMTLPQGLKSFLTNVILETQNAFDLSLHNPYQNSLIPKTNSPLGSQQLVRIYLETLLILLLRQKDETGHLPIIISSKETMGNHIAAQIIDFMEAHLGENLSLNKICDTVNYGKTYVSTIFKETTGYSVIEYYNILKIARAKKLLRESNDSITHIAESLGFNDPRYFSRSFKKVTGMTPTKYVQSIKL